MVELREVLFVMALFVFVVDVMALFVAEVTTLFVVEVTTLFVLALSIVQGRCILVWVQGPKSEIHSFSPPELKT